MEFNRKTFWRVIFPTIVLAPLVLSAILNIPTGGLAIGDENSWVGFFGNYSGGIIGGIIAYVVAAAQIKANRDEIKKNEIENCRSYIILEEFIAPVKLKNVITHNNSKILSNAFYEAIKIDPASDGKSIAFFKIHHSGQPDIILDCDIRVILTGGSETSPSGPPYTIESHLSVFEKGTEIFIPLSNKQYQYIYPESVAVKYKTIKGEKISFFYDVKIMEEKHVLLNEDNSEKELLYNINLKGVEWIYPAKFRPSDEKNN